MHGRCSGADGGRLASSDGLGRDPPRERSPIWPDLPRTAATAAPFSLWRPPEFRMGALHVLHASITLARGSAWQRAARLALALAPPGRSSSHSVHVPPACHGGPRRGADLTRASGRGTALRWAPCALGGGWAENQQSYTTAGKTHLTMDSRMRELERRGKEAWAALRKMEWPRNSWRLDELPSYCSGPSRLRLLEVFLECITGVQPQAMELDTSADEERRRQALARALVQTGIRHEEEPHLCCLIAVSAANGLLASWCGLSGWVCSGTGASRDRRERGIPG
eukprot:scaffold912_cov422-Prasinococcus_capsulatus_cf.AAC.18